MMPLIGGLDGINKMSKSVGNYIGVTECANDMFGKVLSISDELMWRYYELLSSKSLGEIAELKKSVEDGSFHPKKAKELLAMELVAKYHSQDEAQGAKDEFDKVHSQNEIPTDINTYTCSAPIWIAKALVDSVLESSTTQARRDIGQKDVRLNQEVVSDEQLQLGVGEYILQVGKRKFVRLEVQ